MPVQSDAMTPRFDPSQYGEEVARILALGGGGERLMPLTQTACTSDEARRMIQESKLRPAVRAGLMLYFACWNEAHQIAQNIDTAEGSYWHAIVHRQEPDAGNSGYWFRQVGSHPIFPALRERAAEIGVDFGPRWDPLAFIDYCGRAGKGSEEERQAMEVQRAEWQLLFNHCAQESRA